MFIPKCHGIAQLCISQQGTEMISFLLIKYMIMQTMLIGLMAFPGGINDTLFGHIALWHVFL